jgi:hypothetical protein
MRIKTCGFRGFFSYQTERARPDALPVYPNNLELEPREGL